MIRSLFTAATGMIAQQLNLDVIANNLANVNTTGFKKSKADFQDLMYQIIQEPGASQTQPGTSPNGIQVGLGVRPAGVGKQFSQGDFESTQNPLDIAIEGDGFFQVQLPGGGQIAYTRSGSFKLNDQGQMVTADGLLLDPAVNISPEAVGITITPDGIVNVRLPGQTQAQQAGQIQVTRFQNPSGLRAVGKNLFEQTEAAGQVQQLVPGQQGAGTLAQGFLESSNVSVVEEIVKMVTGQRAYEANSKVIQTADQLLSNAVNVKR